MDKLPKYKVMPADEAVIIFFPQSLDIISMKLEDFDKTTEEQMVGCYEKFLESYKNRLNSASRQSAQKIELYKLMLDLTDDCNLDCHYCYASKYYKKQNMSEETIEKVISKFFLSDSIAGVGRIVFFGGEPLLNLAGMEYIINRLEELFAKGKISYLPRFNIITNGTIYSERISQLFKKYQMGILVSCDGPPELQNDQRPFRGSRKGSYDVVARNIKKMISDGLYVGVECTVTKRGIEAGYTHAKFKNFFLNEFNLENLSCVPENMTSPEKKMDFFPKFYENTNPYYDALENLEYQNEMFEIPYRLLTKKPLLYACGLARYSFHILANGDLYPCQLIAGMKEFKITDIDSFNDSFLHKNNWIERYNEHSGKCDSCWIKPLCKFCPARQILESNCYTLPESRCARQREQMEDLIKRIVKLRQNPTHWSNFTRRLAEQADLIETETDIRYN